MRPLKFVIGLLLLPLCVAATRTVAAIVQSLQPAALDHLPATFWGLVIGFFLWVFVFLVLPRPMRTYILAHELTHGLWAWVTGAQIRAIKVGKTKGSITVTKDNFLITLSPYFFPLYTVLVIIVHFAVSMFYDQSVYQPFWLGLVGLSWAFHLTFTLSMLTHRQPDITDQGRVFSYAVIYLMNVLGIGLWIVMVASPTLEQFADQFGRDLRDTWLACRDLGLRLWTFSRVALEKR
ncbi:MAG: hypothetical protein JXB04_04615 [Kiritimatiellae bacterium]|nr:hypothetical protein [Kiritimatiellia bacterium]